VRGNRRYNLRRRTPLFATVNKDTPQRKVKPKIQRSVTRESQEEFPQFPRLPQEIRLKIWDLVTDERRAIIIHSRVGDPDGGFRSPTPVPAALQVCMESREVALKKYELAFSGRHVHWGLDYPARIWFNFEQDMVYFRRPDKGGQCSFWDFRSLAVTKDIERIRFLGFDVERGRGWGLPHILEAWKGLEVYYCCYENARLEVKRTLTTLPLRGSKERAFARHYRWHYGRNGRFKGLSLPTAIEKIKKELLVSPRVQGMKMPEAGLIAIVNS